MQWWRYGREKCAFVGATVQRRPNVVWRGAIKFKGLLIYLKKLLTTGSWKCSNFWTWSPCRHTHFSQRSRHDCMAAAYASLGDLRTWTHHVERYTWGVAQTEVVITEFNCIFLRGFSVLCSDGSSLLIRVNYPILKACQNCCCVSCFLQLDPYVPGFCCVLKD